MVENMVGWFLGEEAIPDPEIVHCSSKWVIAERVSEMRLLLCFRRLLAK